VNVCRKGGCEPVEKIERGVVLDSLRLAIPREAASPQPVPIMQPCAGLLAIVGLRPGARTFDLRTVGVDLVASVVEPQDALRRVRDGHEVALALAQRGERQAQEEDDHWFATCREFNVAQCPSMLLSLARQRGSNYDGYLYSQRERTVHACLRDGWLRCEYKLYQTIGGRRPIVYKE
jgi:hypothetical protein